MKGTSTDIQEDAFKKKIKDFFDPENHPVGFCPVKDVIDRIGDKWSLLTILNLGYVDKIRFNELKTKIEGISQRMLTVTLRSLERDGFIYRHVFAEVPPRVEYELSELGKKLLIQVWEMADWANLHKNEIIAARKLFDSKKEYKKRS